eukprot:6189111-Pleurochrysis_carterae.AAC.3
MLLDEATFVLYLLHVGVKSVGWAYGYGQCRFICEYNGFAAKVPSSNVHDAYHMIDYYAQFC